MDLRPGIFRPRLRRGGRFAVVLRGVVAALLLGVVIGVTGCAPRSDPKPTPTPLFTSEADAFKAAEQVYREYVDATNLSNDGKSDSDPLNFLAGAALDDALAGVRKREAAETSVRGHVVLVDFQGASATVDSAVATVKATVCIDVGKSWLVNAAGEDVTPPTRPARALLAVGFSQVHRGLLITQSDLSEGTC